LTAAALPDTLNAMPRRTNAIKPVAFAFVARIRLR
jgi:hypothetical protein